MVDDALVALLAARVRELEATQAGLVAEQARMAGQLAEATSVSSILAQAGHGDTGPMPAVAAAPRSHAAKRDRHGLHIVRGYAAAPLLWLAKMMFGTVKAHKIGTALGLLAASLLMAAMPTVRLDDHALVVNQAPPVAVAGAMVAHRRHPRELRQHRAVMSRRR